MKKKYFFKFLLTFCFTAISFGQTTLKFQDFEGGTDDWIYAESPSRYNVSNDVWAIVTTVKTPVNAPQNGANFWGIRDLENNNGGSSSEHTLTFKNVDISNKTGVAISFYYITHGFDKRDYLKVEIFYDDVSQGVEKLSKNTGAWIIYAKPVPDAVNNVKITVRVKQDGDSDYAGLDNFKVRYGVAATCGFNFGTDTATCDAFTGNVDSSDTYNVSIPYTGGGDSQLNVTTTSGNIEGDSPASSSTGTIEITGITEGTDITVTVEGGLCNKTINITSPNNCVAQKKFPIYEPFNQVVDTDLVSDPYWINNSATSTGEIKLVSGTLSNPYNTGQFAEPTGNMVSFAGSGSDSYIIFPKTSSDTIYASFIFTVSDISSATNSAGGYFAALAANSRSFPVKLWVKKNGADDSKYDIGVSSGSTASNYHTVAHTPGNEVFIVLAYDFTANQIMVWINPDSASFGSGGTIPTATLTESGASPANLGRFLLRQDHNTKTPTINFDELRISTSWADVTPRGATASIIESSIEGFTVYPNPVKKGRLTIATSSYAEKEVIIYNILGKRIFSQKFDGNKKQLDISRIKTGVYIMKVIETDKIATKKLVIR